jgi:hypothetical protein
VSGTARTHATELKTRSKCFEEGGKDMFVSRTACSIGRKNW